MTTAPPTLTDRYIDAILRHLPARQRADIEKELRASIADALDDRLAAGEDPAAAERAVLTELGDPARLAARYADRPLQLIGPALYPGYRRLLTALLVTIVPAIATVAGTMRALSGGGVPDVAVEVAGAALTTTVHLAFWTTLIFALIERAGMPRPATPWTPDALPTPPSRRTRYAELVTVTVAMVLFTAFILLSPGLGLQRDATGSPIGIFSPWLWETGVVYVFIALVVAMLGVTFAKYYLRWSVPLAVIGTIVEIACPAMLIWLVLNDRLLNPAFVEAAGWSAEALWWIALVVIVTSVLTILQSLAEQITRARS